MKRNKIILILMCVCLLAGFLAGGGAILPWLTGETHSTPKPDLRVASMEEFKNLFVGLKTEHYKNEIPSDLITVLKRRAELSDDSSVVCDAILQLWINEERDFVELMWWRKRDSTTRAFIVALEWCSKDQIFGGDMMMQDGSIHYDEMADRYEDIERQLRRKEVDVVVKNHRALRNDIYKILLVNHIGLADQYKPTAKKP